MPVLRSKAAYCSRKLSLASIEIMEKLSKIQEVKLRIDEEDGVIGSVPLEIEIPQHIRCTLLECKKEIDKILEACKEDKGF